MMKQLRTARKTELDVRSSESEADSRLRKRLESQNPETVPIRLTPQSVPIDLALEAVEYHGYAAVPFKPTQAMILAGMRESDLGAQEVTAIFLSMVDARHGDE